MGYTEGYRVAVTVLTCEQGSGGKKREALIPLEEKTRASSQRACERPLQAGYEFKGYKISFQLS
jgi:hypothetical protein